MEVWATTNLTKLPALAVSPQHDLSRPDTTWIVLFFMSGGIILSKRGITPFPFWQTKKTNGVEDRYIRLGNSQMCSFAMKSLNPNSFKVYAHMLLESGGSMDFQYPYAKFKTICSKDGFQRAKQELLDKGFIVVK